MAETTSVAPTLVADSDFMMGVGFLYLVFCLGYLPGIRRMRRTGTSDWGNITHKSAEPSASLDTMRRAKFATAARESPRFEFNLRPETRIRRLKHNREHT
jgi:hypothetical protein